MKEIEALVHLVCDGYAVSYGRLTVCDLGKLVKGKKRFQVHLDDANSELYENPVVAVKEFMKLKKKRT